MDLTRDACMVFLWIYLSGIMASFFYDNLHNILCKLRISWLCDFRKVKGHREMIAFYVLPCIVSFFIINSIKVFFYAN